MWSSIDVSLRQTMRLVSFKLFYWFLQDLLKTQENIARTFCLKDISSHIPFPQRSWQESLTARFSAMIPISTFSMGSTSLTSHSHQKSTKKPSQAANRSRLRSCKKSRKVRRTWSESPRRLLLRLLKGMENMWKKSLTITSTAACTESKTWPTVFSKTTCYRFSRSCLAMISSHESGSPSSSEMSAGSPSRRRKIFRPSRGKFTLCSTGCNTRLSVQRSRRFLAA